jgi:hypothetical protein
MLIIGYSVTVTFAVVTSALNKRPSMTTLGKIPARPAGEAALSILGSFKSERKEFFSLHQKQL